MTPLSEKGFKILNRMNRKIPDYLSPIWQGFDEPTTDECLLGENFSIYLNPKHLGIGAGVGALAGLSYGYWDYNDAKKQAAKKGLQKPDKKKILIRDTLIGLGLGTAASPLATMFLNTLENKRVTQEQKDVFDKLEQDILKGHDKNKLTAHLNNYKNKLAPDQYNTLKTLVDAHTEFKKDEPKKYIPPKKEMSYKEKMERLEDSLPSPLNSDGGYNMDAINKIQNTLPPAKASQYLNRFGIRMNDLKKGGKKSLDNIFKSEEQMKADIALAKEEPTLVPDTVVTKNAKPKLKKPTKKELKAQAKLDALNAAATAESEANGEFDYTNIYNYTKPTYDGYDKSEALDADGNLLTVPDINSGSYYKNGKLVRNNYTPKNKKSGKNKKIQDNFNKAKSNVSKTTSDLADALFGAYFSNKAQIFRNYNAQKRRW